MKKTSLALAFAALAMAAFLTACNKGKDKNKENGGNIDSTPATNLIEIVKVEGLTFTGSAANTMWEEEGAFTAERNITVSDFYMGKYEVTKDQYKAVMSDSTLNTFGVTADPSWSTNEPEEYVISDGETDGRRPVENVTWYDAVYFCNCLSEKDGLTPAYTITDATVSEETISNEGTDGTQTITIKYISSATVDLVDGANGWRLPTEVEWEYAARGGSLTYGTDKWNYEYSGADSTLTSYDDSDSALDSAGWYLYNICNNGTTSTTRPSSGTAGYGPHEVGKKAANAFGLYDMSGNVFEWCYDRNASSISSSTPLAGPFSGSCRVLRGGSWDGSANFACVASRLSFTPDSRSYFLGFRVVRSAQ